MTRPTLLFPRIVLSLFLLAFFCSAAAQQKRPSVESVTFDGIGTYTGDRLLDLMVTRPPGFLSSTDYHRQIFGTDMKNIIAFYHQNGYLEAAIVDTGVAVTPNGEGVNIRIRINEGEVTKVDTIKIKGNTVFPDSQLLSFVGLKRGDPFRSALVQQGMIAMASLYADSGYLDATVLPDIQLNATEHRAAVLINVAERNRRVITDIRITGLEKTDRDVVTREFLFAEGEFVRYSALLETQRKLYLTGLFEGVFIRPENASTDSMSVGTIIRVEVREKLSGEFNVVVGFGSVEKVLGRVEIMNTNLGGTGRQAGVRLHANFIRQGVEASFTEPWTLGSRWQTDLNGLFDYLLEPSYELRRFGGLLTVGRTLRGTERISLSYRYENASLIDVRTIERPEEFDPRVRSLAVSYRNDTRDNLFDPTRGRYIEWTNELAGAFLQGTNTFARSIVRVKQFYSFDRSRTVIGTSFDGGWMDYFGGSGSIPISERFFAGGPNALRAFRYQEAGPLDLNGDPLGGQLRIVWNVLEVRRAIYKMFGAAAFFDAGNVWTRLAEFRPDDIRTSAGLGIRAHSPIGIVRVDYSFNLSPRPGEPGSRLYFSMGQAF